MAKPLSITWDDVMGLLRSPLVQGFEAGLAARRGLSVYPDWGDSQKLARELASAGICRADIEQLLQSEAALLEAYWRGLSSLPDDGEEWPEGEEPGEDEKPVVVGALPMVMRGFSLTVACETWLLRSGDHSRLVAWLKMRRIPFHRKHAGDLRALFHRLEEGPG